MGGARLGEGSGYGDGPAMAGRWRRRRVLQGAAGGLAVGSVLSACGTAARPQTQDPVITVVFQPHLVAMPSGNRQTAVRLVTQALAQFQAHGGSRGIRIRPVFSLGTTHTLAALLAGSGPDVVQDWVYAPFVDHGLLRPLDGYFKRDAVNTSLWSRGQLDVYRRGGQTYAVPAFSGTVVYAYNQGLFDQAGRPYPTPAWDETAFVDVCRQMTGTVGGNKRWGGMLYQWNNTLGNGAGWVFNAFGGSVMNRSGTRSTLGSSGSVAAGRWMFHQLYWPQICANISTPMFWQLMPKGLLAMEPIGSWTLLQKVLGYQGLKWDILPFPVFPAGRTTLGNDDFFGVSAQSKHPDAAWSVVRWASLGKFWNTFNIKIQLLTPARVDLWDYWVQAVQQIAPPLRGKQLQWFADAAVHGYALAPQYYRYNNAVATAAVGGWLSKLFTRTESSVRTAFGAADLQVDAIERRGKAAVGTVRAVAGQLAAAGRAGGAYTFAAPTRSGLGVASRADAGLLTRGTAGAYRLVGDGASVFGIHDNCGFAGAMARQTPAVFTCRLTALRNATCPQLSPFAAAGLMVRGDLSDDAPMVLVSVTAAQGVGVVYRPLAAQTTAREVAAAPAASAVTRKPPGAHANVLLRPLWLRLQRSGRTWQAYSSPDGKRFTPAGAPVTVDLAGAWVGLYACANNAPFHGRGTIQADFDQVGGFTPATVVQIGSRGLPA